MESIKSMLGPNHPFGLEAEALWKEYASDSTPEANFVKDLDKLELIIQAVEYEHSNNTAMLFLWSLIILGEGICFEKWIVACKDKIRHPELKAILKQVLEESPSQFK